MLCGLVSGLPLGRLLGTADDALLARDALGGTRDAVGVERRRLLAQVLGADGGVGGYDAIHQRFATAEVVEVVDGDEGERPAHLACAACAADAVDVVLRVLGDVEVHDVAYVGDVDAAGQDIGRDEHVRLVVAEVREGAFALVLAAVAMDGGGRDARTAQAAAAGVGAVLGACEDNHVLRTGLLEDLGEQGVFRLERDR